MAYRTVKEYGGEAVAAGQFPAVATPFTSNPDNNNVITITFNGVSRAYTFVDNGGASTRFQSSPTTKCQIGATIKHTIQNLINTINTSPQATEIGTPGTITPVLSGSDTFIVYGNEKTTSLPACVASPGSFLGSSSTIQNGQLVRGAYPDKSSTDGPYNNSYSAICFSGTGVVNRDLLVLKEVDGDAYNIGPPKSRMHVVSVPLQGGVIHEIQTFGSTAACVLFG